ncbi:protein ABHD11-like [Ylistrum balloti]|uniref:protein ABHD11-like n=1 Tax=Ylistrum balloti TaxID=509963 RepID=UPI002905C6A1|nr:protein ABHD11-like [Ylistrum balloti]
MHMRVLAKNLHAQLHPVLFDLPNHGSSPWVSPGDFIGTQSIVEASIDAECSAMGLARDSKIHLVGHSLGGKYAMIYALQNPQRVATLVVLDIAPMTYPAINTRYFDAYRNAFAQHPHNRKEYVEHLHQNVQQKEIAFTLSKNVYQDEKGDIRLYCNLDEIEKQHDALRSFPSAYDVKRYDGPTLFVRAEHTEYFPDNAEQYIQRYFTQYSIAQIEGSTHFLHIDSVQLVSQQLNALYTQYIARKEE